MERQRDVVIHHAFLDGGFKEIASRGLPFVPTIRGKHALMFDSIFQNAQRKLRSVDAFLPEQIVQPIASFTNSNKKTYDLLPNEQKQVIDDIRTERLIQIHDGTISITPLFAKQTIQKGLLAVPTYFAQDAERTCATACFRMITNDVLGENIAEQLILDYGEKNGFRTQEQIPGRGVPKDAVFSLLTTQTFHELFPNWNFSQQKLYGTDFEDLSQIVKQIKQEKPQARVYSMLSIASEVTEGWHSILLLSVDESEAVIHDPSSTRGSAFRKIPKDEFSRRWGETFLSGRLIIASPRQI